MMNKFHKTSYARGANFNGVSSSHGRRTNNPNQQPEWPSLKNQQPLQRKIEIESSLLLNHKNYQQHSNNTGDTINRKITNKSQVKLYETTTGFTNIRQRPQSKQEPRSKGTVETKLKTEVFLPDRPQTSKGARHFRGKATEQRDHQTGENYEEFPIQVKITDKRNRSTRSSYSKRGSQINQSNVVAFDTSIDPEFLSLFAN